MYKTCNLQQKHTHSSIHIHVVHNHKKSNIHHVQEFNMFMTIYKENTIAKLNTRILILRISFPSNSYVTTMLHPTIGQCDPYSLSIIATHEIGMISKGNLGEQTYTQ